MGTRLIAAAVALLPLSTGCSPDVSEEAPSAVERSVSLAPHFPPEETAATPAVEASATPAEAPSATAGAVPPEVSPTAAPGRPAPLRGSVSDRSGDVSASADSHPRYADLMGADLTRREDGYELRVRASGPFPERGPDDRTMNVAAFVETDGDGRIDHEVWANLADSGWGTSYHDGRTGRSRYMESSGVSAHIEGGVLVLRFRLEHLGAASSFRWALASEWGRYEVISTPAAARDAAPDGPPASFPN